MFIYKIDWLHFIAETVVRTSNLVKLYTGKSHDEKIHGFFSYSRDYAGNTQKIQSAVFTVIASAK